MLLSVTAVLVMRLALIEARYGEKYPVSAAWFEDRFTKTQWDQALDQFANIGGDTVLLRGAQYNNRTAESIVADAAFAKCVDNGVHCVERAKSELIDKLGLNVQGWITYSYEENYGETMTDCNSVEKRIVAGNQIFLRLVLWMEDGKTYGDCDFQKGSSVAILFTSFNGTDPHELLLASADERNMSVYMGLPRIPPMHDTESSFFDTRAYFLFIYTIMNDHQKRLAKFSSMTGYYMSESVVPAYVAKAPAVLPPGTNIPPKAVPMLWMETSELASYTNHAMLFSVNIDLTHAGNTTMAEHKLGLLALSLGLGGNSLLISEGRADGNAAYFWEAQAVETILEQDKELWEILHEKNSSVSISTTYNDIYYASINQFFTEASTILSQTTRWLVTEAYNNLTSSPCLPVDPKGSAMDRPVQSVTKQRLDASVAAAGALVTKVAAFAWDPLFLCSETPHMDNLAAQIAADYKAPIISECRFHTPDNLSVVVIGYNLDAMYLSFQVNYTDADDTANSVNQYGYYYEIDYGKEHHLVDSLVYVMLWDIPDMRLKSKGTVSVQAKGASQACFFNYTLKDEEGKELMVQSEN